MEGETTLNKLLAEIPIFIALIPADDEAAEEDAWHLVPIHRIVSIGPLRNDSSDLLEGAIVTIDAGNGQVERIATCERIKDLRSEIQGLINGRMTDYANIR